jgi:hypothetical protein
LDGHTHLTRGGGVLGILRAPPGARRCPPRPRHRWRGELAATAAGALGTLAA